MKKWLIAAFLVVLHGTAQAQMSLDEFLGPAGVDAWQLECNLRGACSEFVAIDRLIIESWEACLTRPRPIPLNQHNVIRWRLLRERWNQGRTLAHAMGIWPACNSEPDPEPDPDPKPDPDHPRGGPVYFDGHAFADNFGQFKGFGATYFSALHWGRRDRAKLIANLDFLADRGVNYIRILTVVGGDYWNDRKIDPGWPGYFSSFNDLFVDARNAGTDRNSQGVRLQVTIFGDVNEFVAEQDQRIDWLKQIGGYLEGHRDQVMFVEIANESTGIGLNVADLAELTEIWREISDIPVAASAVYDTDDDLRDYNGRLDQTEEGTGIEKFFQAYRDVRVDLLTPHFDRSQREDGYRSARQPWHPCFYDFVPLCVFTNNEPIGLGSSDQSQRDPGRLAMDLVNTFMGRGAGYVMHSSAGVRGDHDFWEEPGIEPAMLAMRHAMNLLPDGAANGSHQNHHWDGHPFVYHDQIWPETGGDGVVRAYATEVGGVFYVAPMGMRGSYHVTAKWAMAVEVFDVVSGERVEIVNLDAGQEHWFFPLANGARDFIFRITRR